MIARARDFVRLLRAVRRPLPELRALQERKLRELVRHAYQNVPFYRDKFDRAGIAPADVRTLEDLQAIPLTTRRELQDAGVESRLDRRLDPGELRTASTSGSSGAPLTVAFTRAERKMRGLVDMRSLVAVGFRPWQNLFVLGPTTGMTPSWPQRLGVFRVDKMSGLAPVEQQVSRLRRADPTILWAYPSTLRALLENVGGDLRSVCEPRALVTSAEVFDPHMLDGRERALPHLNFYGSIEMGRIAWECHAHQGLHVNLDQVILELLPPDPPLEDDEAGVGETVVTSLNARAMPFIRYRLGDLCYWAEGETSCPCGVTLPRIGPPVGRVSGLIRLPSGRALTRNGLGQLFRGYGGIRRYRVTQRTLDRFEVEVTPHDALSGREREDLLVRLRDLLAEPVRIQVRCVDRIESEGLKFRDFVSDVVSR